ncbi:MAG: Ig-like domain-containing protein [Pyrinomonadaceae bacterium]
MRSLTGVTLTLLIFLFFGNYMAAQTPPSQTPQGPLAKTLAPDEEPAQARPTPDACDVPDRKKPGGRDLGLLPTRKYAPTVGTGGPVGGPTGLLTVYDGKTLREGDYTYSLAYSNFDRDPGNVDITEVPNSFNYGLPYRMEFFFSYDVYRGVKVNNPRTLSSFYLPNSQLFFGPGLLGSGPAFVLAPLNNRGLAGAVFRPAFNQPFVQFPFVGQASGNFGVTGIPTFAGTLAVQGTGGGRFGAAANFPGIGSVYGSILPGVILSTTAAGPQTFALAPSYLPDAPFINRLFGESSLSTFTVGLKIRFRDRLAPTNFGIIPFYRFYADRANDFRGFNQLQRGASPGGNLGDLGLIGFISRRATRNVTLSGNLGYILNSNPTSDEFGTQRVTLLDRPNELLYGVAADFYFKRADHWQPIVELRGTKYVGGRTPNVLENNPLDFLIGTRYFVSEHHGITVGYRLHLNQQGDSGGISGPLPPGGIDSSNPHGLIVQLWAGRRAPRKSPTIKVIPKASPNRTDFAEIVLACPRGETSASGSCPRPDPLDTRIPLEATIEDASGKPLNLQVKRWEASGGRIVGEGREVVWDLSGVSTGTYFADAIFEDDEGTEVHGTFCIPVRTCPDCRPTPTPPIVTPTPVCPTLVEVTPGQQSVVAGTPTTFTARVEGLPAGTAFSYRWTVSGGSIVGAADGQTITVDTSGQGGTTITASLRLEGLDPSCRVTAQAETPVFSLPVCKVFDAYGAIPYNDEKARLDNFVIALNDNQQLDGYLIAYSGGTAGRNIGTIKNPLRGGIVDAQHRMDRATSYIRDRRGYTKLIEAVNGGGRAESSVELYVCEPNAVRPSPKPETATQPEPSPNPPSQKEVPRPRAHAARSKKRLRSVVR